MFLLHELVKIYFWVQICKQGQNVTAKEALDPGEGSDQQ